jgi:hypothetical protein
VSLNSIDIWSVVGNDRQSALSDEEASHAVAVISRNRRTQARRGQAADKGEGDAGIAHRSGGYLDRDGPPLAV